ncbi:MAG: nuclear transport factor 2 family protein [Myxococcaceae bacterium]
MKRLLLAGLLCLSSYAFADPVADAKAVNEAFITAANITDPEKSIQAVAALFTDDLRHIGAFGVVNGKAELVKAISGPFHAPNRKNELISQEGAVLDKDTVLTIAHFNTSFTAPDGKNVTLPLRCTRLMKKQKDGKYLIAAEQTSFGPPAPPAPPSK